MILTEDERELLDKHRQARALCQQLENININRLLQKPIRGYDGIILDLSTHINALTKTANCLISDIEKMSKLLSLPVNFVEENILPLDSRVTRLREKHRDVQQRFNAEYTPLRSEITKLSTKLDWEVPTISSQTSSQLQKCLLELKTELDRRMKMVETYKASYYSMKKYLGIDTDEDQSDKFSKLDKDSLQSYKQLIYQLTAPYNSRHTLINSKVRKLRRYCSIANCELPEIVHSLQTNGSDKVVEALDTELDAIVSVVHWRYVKQINSFNISLGLHFRQHEHANRLEEPSEKYIEVLESKLKHLKEREQEPGRRIILDTLLKYEELVLSKEETIDKLKKDISPKSYISSHIKACRLREQVEKEKRIVMKEIIEVLNQGELYFCNDGHDSLYDVLVKEKNNPRLWSPIISSVLAGKPVGSNSGGSTNNISRYSSCISYPRSSMAPSYKRGSANMRNKSHRVPNEIIYDVKPKMPDFRRHSCGIKKDTAVISTRRLSAIARPKYDS